MRFEFVGTKLSFGGASNGFRTINFTTDWIAPKSSVVEQYPNFEVDELLEFQKFKAEICVRRGSSEDLHGEWRDIARIMGGGFEIPKKGSICLFRLQGEEAFQVTSMVEESVFEEVFEEASVFCSSPNDKYFGGVAWFDGSFEFRENYGLPSKAKFTSGAFPWFSERPPRVDFFFGQKQPKFSKHAYLSQLEAI